MREGALLDSPGGLFHGREHQDETTAAHRGPDLAFRARARGRTENGRRLVYSCGW